MALNAVFRAVINQVTSGDDFSPRIFSLDNLLKAFECDPENFSKKIERWISPTISCLRSLRTISELINKT